MAEIKRNVAHDVCDWKENFTTEQVRECTDYAGGEGEVYMPDIGHFVDAKVLLVGPAGMDEWLEEHAIMVHDLPDDKDGLYWDGKELFVLHGERIVPIREEMDTQSGD